MRVKNLTPFVFGFKACSRKPPQPEMMVVVRGKFDLRPGHPLRPSKGDKDVDPAALELEEQDGAGAEASAKAMEMGLSILGQGALSDESFDDEDAARMGASTYPGDFADFKLNAEVMLSGTCHLPAPKTEARVAFSVGKWEKTLKVMGVRVWLDESRLDATRPLPFREMPLDYMHAYGGAGYKPNPVGKGYFDPAAILELEESGDTNILKRSAASAVQIESQLPNVLHAGGSDVKNDLPASFAPLSSMWPHRVGKRGTMYDEQWREERAPYYAKDFDWTHFHAAPPDQQIDGYLVGDETLRFENLHPESKDFSVDLPGLRLRMFYMTSDEAVFEVPMVLDTLYANTDDEALFMQWRGVGQVTDEELTDVEFALVVYEYLEDPPEPADNYALKLREFSRDPTGMDEFLPEGAGEAADLAELIEDGDDEDLEGLTDAGEGVNPVTAVLTNLLGPMGAGLIAETRPQFDQVSKTMGPANLKQVVIRALKEGRRSQFPVRTNAAMGAAYAASVAGRTINLLAKKLGEIKETVPDAPELQQVINGLSENPDVKAIAPDMQVKSESAVDADVAPGADLSGRDLTGHDLSGCDLSGADLSGATLDHAKLTDAVLKDANLSGARLYRTDLARADLAGADLSMAAFNRCNAVEANFSDTLLAMTTFTKVKADGATFSGAKGEMCDFSKCSLRNVVADGIAVDMGGFTECKLQEAVFTKADLQKTLFKKCQAQKIDLGKSELSNSGFLDSNLTDAVVSGAKGEQTVWTRAMLIGTDFSLCAFPKAFFSNVVATGANFNAANLEDCRFDWANLKDSRFLHANLFKGSLRKAVLTGVTFDHANVYQASFNQTAGVGCSFRDTNVKEAFFERSELVR